MDPKSVPGQVVISRDDKCRAREREEQMVEMHAELVRSLKSALDHYYRYICIHETTHRGGAIWTVCDSCGAHWSDDRGGFKPYEDPQEIADANVLLAKAEALQC